MSEEKGFVSKLKENYLNFIDSLREKGVPSPHLIVPLVVIIIIGAAFLLVPGIAVEKRNISLTVKDSLSRTVSGATAEIVLNNNTIATQTSDASGKVSFTNIPINAQVRITADGFASKTRSVSELSQQATISLQSTGPPTTDVAFKILDSSDQQPINGAFVQLSFANGDFAPQATSDAGGNVIVAIQESQVGAATATVTSTGFESIQQAVSQEQIESGTPITITLSSQDASTNGNGDFTVRVTSNGNGVKNARVVLIDVVTNSERASERTTDDGSVVFQEVAFGQAFTIRVSHPNYEQAEQEFTPTRGNADVAVQLTSRTSPAMTITLTVLDEELTPLNAVVNLFDANTNSLLETGETNSVGEFTASVATNINAYATAYVDGYLPAYIGDLSGGSTKSITLQQALPGNSVPVTVVVTQDGFSASNAEVSLYRSGGFFLGVPPFRVGSNGIGNATIPTTIDAASYRVFANASKEAFYGKSDLVEVGTIPISLSVNLLATPGNLTIALKDLSTGQLVQSGSIEATVLNLPVSTCTIVNGTCTLPVAANKEFSLRASAPGYLPYSTTSVAYSAGEKANLTISLFPISLAQGTTATFLGLFDSSNVKVNEVQNADTYSARFAVNMPQNVEQAGFYFQVGDEQTVEESVAAITNFDSNGASFVQSDSKLSTSANNNQSCYSGQNTPNTDDKWAYFSFPRGFVGTKEFSFKVKVSRSAEPGASINLHYKAFAFKDNLPLLAPADGAMLETLRQKIDVGSQLVPADTCQLKTFDQTIAVSQQTLRCDENDICTKAILSDLTSVGSPSTFQPQIARDFTFEFEVLSPVSIDSAMVSTDHFNVKNSQQVLTGSSIILFQEAPVTISATAIAASGRQFNLPFTSLANKKAKISMTLTPLKISQSAPLIFTLRSGDKTFSIPLTLSVSGQNTFTVTAAPPQIPAAQDGKITVVVRDRNNRAMEDASVTLFECIGSPFSGNEPSQVTGDSSSNNGQNGRYRIEATPSGLGEIGVRVESPDFKTFESCLVSVSGGDFLSISPDAMEFTGSSIENQAQQVTLTNSLNEPIHVSTSINCGGDPVPAKIFPTSTTIEPNSDSTISIKLLQNITSSAQCLAYFNARAGAFKSVQELPISFNVNCPNCALGISTGSISAPLPQAVTLFATPPFFQDSVSLQLRLSADPTCTLDGFRINYAGMYAPQAIQSNGVLGGLQRPNLWNCAACGQADASGSSQCNSCQQVYPSNVQCGFCQPPITAPTSSSLPSHAIAQCSQCYNAHSAFQTNAFMTPLAAQGYPVPFNPAYAAASRNNPGLTPSQRVAFDPAVGAVYGEDVGVSSNFYNTRFGVQPILPGSQMFPNYNGYNRGSGFSQNMLRDALRVDQCTKDAITISADYSFLGQAYPGTGNLAVTLPDGTTKTIRVNVLSSPPVGGQGLQGQLPWPTQCGTGETIEGVITPDYKLSASVSLSCPIPFDQKQIQRVETLNGEAIQGAVDNCVASLANNDLKISCDFSKNEKVKEIANSQKSLVIKARALSTQNPNADLQVTIKATFEKVTVPPRQEPADVDTSSGSSGGSSSSGGSIREPTPSVSLKVYKESDTNSRNNLCGKRIESGAKLKLIYSFSNNGDASSRAITINKQETSTWPDAGSIPSTQLTSASGQVPYTLTKTSVADVQKFTFKASSTYSGVSVPSKNCEIRATTKPQIITQIKAVWVQPLVTSPKEFKWLYPETNIFIGTQLDIDSALLKIKANKKPVKVMVEYSCQGGNSHKVQQEYIMNNPYFIDPSAIYGEITSSIEFTKCMPQVDSDIGYQINVTLLNSKNEELETSYYVAGKPAVSDASEAGFITIANYPEAPQRTTGGESALPAISNDEEFAIAQFDSCGRINAPIVSSINLTRVKQGGGEEAIKSSESLYPGKDFVAKLCTKDKTYSTGVAGSTVAYFELLLEYQDKYSHSQLTRLGSCKITAADEANVCSIKFNTNQFLDPDKIKELNLDITKKVSLKTRILYNTPSVALLPDNHAGVVSGSQRYFCKYWPTEDGLCGPQDVDKVEFKLSARDPQKYDLTPHCQVDANNKNILTCDLQEGEEIEIPGKMR
ncbi:MAG: carboxypeptidase-like regulatory domain-containing protein, partial [Candidatus Micrarchaeota archaeon]|nr:carboxypeptidase-like regulatory domain-containing protein [Candidatus Micrarchaeota archaeon]